MAPRKIRLVLILTTQIIQTTSINTVTRLLYNNRQYNLNQSRLAFPGIISTVIPRAYKRRTNSTQGDKHCPLLANIIKQTQIVQSFHEGII